MLSWTICFHLLAREPHRGRTCDDIRSGYRKYHIGRHLVFYLESARYLHNKNPLARLFGIRIGYKVAVSFSGEMERDYR
ncbi:MAG: type II toxin-antitoxin system RelE/ParE family toxin [Nostoc sp.]